MQRDSLFTRSRWAAVGAAVAVSIGGGGLMSASATLETGERAVFVPITPCRVMDTRPAPSTVGPRNTPIGAAQTHTISVLGANGNCNIPADAVGLSLNVTAINPTAASFLTVFPFGALRPLASNLNWSAGQAPVPNAVTADIGTAGQISFFNLAGTVDVAADIVGYYVDHNHNDLYYTKAQVDAALALKATLPITSAQVLDDTVAGGGLAAVDLAANSVGASEIATDAVNATEIANDSIDSGEIIDFSLSNQDVNVFYAVIQGAVGGVTVVRDSGGVTATRVAVGSYNVDFGRDISNCAWTATAEDQAFNDHGPVAGNVEALNVHVHTEAGTLFDGRFHVMVVC